MLHSFKSNIYNAPITVKYAFANKEMTDFWRTFQSDVDTIMKAKELFIKADHQPILRDANEELAPKKQKLMKKYLPLQHAYEQASLNFANFNKQYAEIFKEGDRIRYEEGSTLLEILGLTTREKRFANYKRKHAHIFNELERLKSEIKKYEPYKRADSCVNRAIRPLYYKIASDNRLKQTQWETQRSLMRQQARNMLRWLTNLSYYIVQDLKVTTNGCACTVECQRMPVDDKTKTFSYYQHTFINEKLHIR